MDGIQINVGLNKGNATEAQLERLDALSDKLAKKPIKIDVAGNIRRSLDDTNKSIRGMLRLPRIAPKVDMRGITSMGRQTRLTTNDMVKSLANVDRSTAKVSKSLSSVGTMFKTAFAVGGMVAAVKVLNDTSDSLLAIRNRLSLVSDGYDEVISKQVKLLSIARDARVDLGSTTGMYVDMSLALTKLGKSSGEVMRVTQTIQKANAMSGQPLESMKAGMIQLQQGLSSGEIRGQELRSVIEQLPYLAKEIRDSLKMTTGELLKFAEAGQFTPEVFMQIIEGMQKKVDADFGKFQATYAQQRQRFMMTTKALLGDINLHYGWSASLGRIWEGASKPLEKLSDDLIGHLTTIRLGFRNLISTMPQDDVVVKLMPRLEVETGETFRVYDMMRKYLHGPLYNLRVDTQRLLDTFSFELPEFVKMPSVDGIVQFTGTVLNVLSKFVATLSTLAVLTRSNITQLLDWIPFIRTYDLGGLRGGIFLFVDEAYKKMLSFNRSMISLRRSIRGTFESLTGYLFSDTRTERAFANIFNVKDLAGLREAVDHFVEIRKILRISVPATNMQVGQLGEMMRGAAFYSREFLANMGLVSPRIAQLELQPLMRFNDAMKVGRGALEAALNSLLWTSVRYAGMMLNTWGTYFANFASQFLASIVNEETGRLLGRGLGRMLPSLYEGLTRSFDGFGESALDYLSKGLINSVKRFFKQILVSASSFAYGFADELTLTIGRSLAQSNLGFSDTFQALVIGPIGRLLMDDLSGISKFFSEVAARIMAAAQGVAAAIAKMYNAVARIADIELPGADTSGAYLQAMFGRISAQAKRLTSSPLASIKKFVEAVNEAFRWVYIQVVGNSWWPDLVDGVIAETKRMIASVRALVAAFASMVSNGFRAVFKSLTSADNWKSVLQTMEKFFTDFFRRFAIGFNSFGAVVEAALIGLGSVSPVLAGLTVAVLGLTSGLLAAAAAWMLVGRITTSVIVKSLAAVGGFTILGGIPAQIAALAGSLGLGLSVASIGAAADIIVGTLRTIERAFFWAYDQIVGHSWWPDTIDGVVNYSKNITKALPPLSGFISQAEDWFRNIDIKMPTFKVEPAKGMLVGFFSAIKFEIENVIHRLATFDYKNMSLQIAQVLGAVFTSAFLILFSGGKFRMAGFFTIGSLIMRLMGDTSQVSADLIGKTFGRLIGNALGVAALSLPKAMEAFIYAIPNALGSMLMGLYPSMADMLDSFAGKLVGGIAGFFTDGLLGVFAALMAGGLLFGGKPMSLFKSITSFLSPAHLDETLLGAFLPSKGSGAKLVNSWKDLLFGTLMGSLAFLDGVSIVPVAAAVATYFARGILGAEITSALGSSLVGGLRDKIYGALNKVTAGIRPSPISMLDILYPPAGLRKSAGRMMRESRLVFSTMMDNILSYRDRLAAARKVGESAARKSGGKFEQTVNFQEMLFGTGFSATVNRQAMRRVWDDILGVFRVRDLQRIVSQMRATTAPAMANLWTELLAGIGRFANGLMTALRASFGHIASFLKDALSIMSRYRKATLALLLGLGGIGSAFASDIPAAIAQFDYFGWAILGAVAALGALGAAYKRIGPINLGASDVKERQQADLAAMRLQQAERRKMAREQAREQAREAAQAKNSGRFATELAMARAARETERNNRHWDAQEIRKTQRRQAAELKQARRDNLQSFGARVMAAPAVAFSSILGSARQQKAAGASAGSILAGGFTTAFGFVLKSFKGGLTGIFGTIARVAMGAVRMLNPYVAGATALGALGAVFFGPADSFLGNLEWAYDKIKSILGLSASTTGTFEVETKSLLAAQDVGGASFNVSDRLNAINWRELSKSQKAMLTDLATVTNERLATISKEAAAAGGASSSQRFEVAQINKDVDAAISRLPSRIGESAAEALSSLDAGMKREVTRWDAMRILGNEVLDAIAPENSIGFWKFFKDGLEAVKGAWNTGMDFLSSSFGKMAKYFSDMVDGALAKIPKIIDSVLETIYGKERWQEARSAGTRPPFEGYSTMAMQARNLAQWADPKLVAPLTSASRASESANDALFRARREGRNFVADESSAEYKARLKALEDAKKTADDALRRALMAFNNSGFNNFLISRYSEGLEKFQKDVKSLGADLDASFLDRPYFERLNRNLQEFAKAESLAFTDSMRSRALAGKMAVTGLAKELSKAREDMILFGSAASRVGGDDTLQRGILSGVDVIGLQSELDKAQAALSNFNLEQFRIVPTLDLKTAISNAKQGKGLKGAADGFMNGLFVMDFDSEAAAKALAKLVKDAKVAENAMEGARDKLRSLSEVQSDLQDFGGITDGVLARISEKTGERLTSLTAQYKEAQRQMTTSIGETGSFKAGQEYLQKMLGIARQIKAELAGSVAEAAKRVAEGSVFEGTLNTMELTGDTPNWRVLSSEKNSKKFSDLTGRRAAQERIALDSNASDADRRKAAKSITEIDKALDKLTSDNSKTAASFQDIMAAISGVGGEMDPTVWVRYGAAAQKSMRAAAIELRAVEELMSKEGSGNMSAEAVAKLEARAAAARKTIRETMATSSVFSGVDVSGWLDGLSKLPTAAGKVIIQTQRKIQALDLELELPVNVEDDAALDAFIGKMRERDKLQRENDAARERAARTLETRLSAISDVFGEMGQLDMFRMFGTDVSRIGETLLDLKARLEQALTGGDMGLAQSILEQFETLDRSKELLSFAAGLSRRLADATAAGVRDGFNSVQGVFGDLFTEIGFQARQGSTRRSLQTSAGEVNEMQTLMNMNNLPKQIADVVNGGLARGDSLSSILSSARGAASSIGFDLALKTPMENLTDAVKDAADAFRGIDRRVTTVDTDKKPGATTELGDITPESFAAMRTRVDASVAAELNRLRSLPVGQALAEMGLTAEKELRGLSEKAQLGLRDGLLSGNDNVRRYVAEQVAGWSEQAFNAAKGATDNIKQSFSSGLSGLLKGQRDEDKSVFQTFLSNILDSFTNTVIDTFVQGLTDKLLGDNLFGLMDSIYSLGGVGSKTTPAEGEGPGMVGGVVKALGEGEEGGGFISSLTSGLESVLNGDWMSGLSGIFDSLLGGMGDALSGIMGMFSGGGGGGGWSGILSGIMGFFGFASGGPVSGPGTGTSDSIPARLSNGEYVINAKATRRFRPMLDAINSGREIMLASGGLVTADAQTAASAGSVGPRGVAMGTVNNSKVDLQVIGDISRQTRAEIFKMMPQIAAGVNSRNREQNNP